MTLRPILAALVCAAALFGLTVCTKPPSQHLDWQTHLGVAPAVDRQGDAATVSPVRDWAYDAAGETSTDWIETGARLDPDALKTVWFVVEPHPGLPVMAHTLVLFEFEGGDLVGLTVEARKERHEEFAPLAGAFRRFELVYVWATPRDLLTRRAVHLGHELFIYPLDLTQRQRRAYLASVLDRTAALHAAPRFYSTLHSNCTSELAKAAGLSWDLAFIFTGRSAEALHAKGLIPGASFEAARARADAASLVKELNGRSSDAFNAALLEALGRRAP